MRILMTGAGGMIGRKLAARLAAEGTIAGQTITAMRLHDIVPPPLPAAAFPVMAETGDLSAPGAAAALVADRPGMVIHLAGVVSAQAEAEFDLGYRVNLDGTRALWDAIRLAGHRPRVIYASTAAVFGGPFPDVVPDDFAPMPLSSYGTQKLIGEVILADYSRRGFMDGIGLRLPTICVRPGAPNKAASGFFSSIIREPLVGQRALLPVPRDWVHSHASPRAAVGFFLHAAGIDQAGLQGRPNITMPGVPTSVAEQIAALERAAPGRSALIDEVPDERIWAIVRTWAKVYDTARARDLGFACEASFEEIVGVHIADELGGQVA
jgi:D-erythronate 2-dehydrogenase